MRTDEHHKMQFPEKSTLGKLLGNMLQGIEAKPCTFYISVDNARLLIDEALKIGFDTAYSGTDQKRRRKVFRLAKSRLTNHPIEDADLQRKGKR